MRYVCELCGLTYDEAGKEPFCRLPADFCCPSCGSEKEAFTPERSRQRICLRSGLLEGYAKYPEEYRVSQR